MANVQERLHLQGRTAQARPRRRRDFTSIWAHRLGIAIATALAVLLAVGLPLAASALHVIR